MTHMSMVVLLQGDFLLKSMFKKWPR